MELQGALYILGTLSLLYEVKVVINTMHCVPNILTQQSHLGLQAQVQMQMPGNLAHAGELQLP